MAYIEMIAAINKKGVIGKNGKLSWDFPEYMKHFRSLVNDNIIIMEREMYRSLGSLSPNTLHIVLTNGVQNVPEKNNVITLSSIDNLNGLINDNKFVLNRRLFIIGGEVVFRDFYPDTKKLHLAFTDSDESGDTFFPISKEEIMRDFTLSDRKLARRLTFETYERKEGLPKFGGPSLFLN